MKTKTPYADRPNQQLNIAFRDFLPEDYFSIKTKTQYEAAYELGKKAAPIIRQTLKEKLSAHVKNGDVQKSESLLVRMKELIGKKIFLVDHIDYLDRYLNTLISWCNGATIPLTHGVLLQSFADIACQTVLVKDEKKHAINLIHIEESPDDEQLIKLNKLLDASRPLQTHAQLLSSHEFSIKRLYQYKVCVIETDNRSHMFFAYPTLCAGGPAFGIDLTSNTIFVADTLTPRKVSRPADLWANAIVSMMFDAGSIQAMEKIATSYKKNKITVVGGYAIHAVSWNLRREMVSYEFASHLMEKQPLMKKGSRSILGQTNYPLTPKLQKIDQYVSPQHDADELQLSHLIKRRTRQLCSIAQKEIYPTHDATHDTENLLKTIASPIGDVETFEHGPAFSGFPTLANAAYVVGSFTQSGTKIVIGKLTPPPIPRDKYSLIFDPSNPTHRAHKLVDLKSLVLNYSSTKKNPSHIAVIYSTPTKRLLKTPFAFTDEDTSYVAGKVKAALTSKQLRCTLHEIHEDSIGAIDSIRADCIFNLVEWTGLDTILMKKVFMHLRKLNIPVTGSTEANYMETANKLTMKEALDKAAIPTPRWQGFVMGNEKPRALPYPVIVKPAYEHGSIGLGGSAIAHSSVQLLAVVKKQIKEFHQPALAEEFIQGRELLVYLFERKNNIHILPIEEITFGKDKPLAFQTYESKWDKGHADYEATKVIMAKLTTKEQNDVEKVCKRVFRKMKFRGYARFDIRLRKGIPYVLETNCNPNIYDSDEDQIPGIPFPDFVEAIINSAFYHYNRDWKI